MHIVAAWFIGAVYISYKYGYQCKMLPKPHRFIGLTGFMSIAAIVSMADDSTGAVLAYGGLLATFLRGQSSKTECDKINVTNDKTSSGSSSSSQQSGNPVVNVAGGAAKSGIEGIMNLVPGLFP